MGIRPSQLWGVEWPLAAFYFDRAVRNWANFVDRKCEEAEMVIRLQMKNRRGTDGFAMQAREVAFNKLLGLSVASAYSAPPTKGLKGEKPRQKRNLDTVAIPRTISAEGKRIDMSGFNG